MAGWSCGDWQYVIGIVQLLGLTAASGSHIIDLLGSKAPPRKAAQALLDLCLNYLTPRTPLVSHSKETKVVLSLVIGICSEMTIFFAIVYVGKTLLRLWGNSKATQQQASPSALIIQHKPTKVPERPAPHVWGETGKYFGWLAARWNVLEIYVCCLHIYNLQTIFIA